MIEHLTSWRELLSEARRAFAPGGLFIVSTPNRLYYAESRRLDGPNPYHVHEFEFEEFEAALREFFPHVAILFQNRVEAFAFHGAAQSADIEVRLDVATNDLTGKCALLYRCSVQLRRFPSLRRFSMFLARPTFCASASSTFAYSIRNWGSPNSGWDQSLADHQKLQAAHEEQTRTSGGGRIAGPRNLNNI